MNSLLLFIKQSNQDYFSYLYTNFYPMNEKNQDIRWQQRYANDIINLSVELDELDLPYKIDLVIYERIQEKALKEHIDSVGILLFKRETSFL